MKYFSVMFCLLLVACGGGGSSVLPELPTSMMGESFQLPLSGTATYIGDASGNFSTYYGTDFANRPIGSISRGEYQGDLRLIVDFDSLQISGDISNIDLLNITITEPGSTSIRMLENIFQSGYVIRFSAADIHENGHFVGDDVEITHPDIDTGTTDGSWFGVFSSDRDVRGTHSGVTNFPGGSRSSWFGTYQGTRN